MVYSNESYSREDEKVRRVSCWQVSEFSITFFQLLRTRPDSYFACVISRETDVKPAMFTSHRVSKYYTLSIFPNNSCNHKNYHFLDCDWYISDSSIDQSHSKLSLKSINHIQSCS